MNGSAVIWDKQYSIHARLKRYRADCAKFQRTMNSQQNIDGAPCLDKCVDSSNWGVGVKILVETYHIMIEACNQSFPLWFFDYFVNRFLRAILQSLWRGFKTKFMLSWTAPTVVKTRSRKITVTMSLIISCFEGVSLVGKTFSCQVISQK